jgi:hypothetical protein
MLRYLHQLFYHSFQDVYTYIWFSCTFLYARNHHADDRNCYRNHKYLLKHTFLCKVCQSPSSWLSLFLSFMQILQRKEIVCIKKSVKFFFFSCTIKILGILCKSCKSLHVNIFGGIWKWNKADMNCKKLSKL